MNPAWIGMIAGLLTSVASLPQVVKTYQSRHARDLSIWQPLLLSVGVAMWLIYGILIRDIPLIVANITPLLCNLALAGMKLKFRHNDPPP
ncbi:MAG: SemiSWEET transporter [Trichlorobacter sp.]|jgi:MtN3 and saliva related transmembrane protein